MARSKSKKNVEQKPPAVKLGASGKTGVKTNRSKPQKQNEEKPLSLANHGAPVAKTVVKLPKIKIEASSNWKSLASALPNAVSGKPRGRDWRRPRRSPKPELNQQAPSEKREAVSIPATLPVVLNEFGFPAYDKDGNCLTKGPLPEKYTRYSKAIAIDCEMVGVGPMGNESALARIALVNEEGLLIYHKYVKPKLPITDYRTRFSGIRPEDLVNGADIKLVMGEVGTILKGHLLVGHSVANDLKVLFMYHPRHAIRDTAEYFKKGAHPKLSRLVSDHLGVTIQDGEHNPIEDSQAVMKLYMKYKRTWENAIKYGAHRHYHG